MIQRRVLQEELTLMLGLATLGLTRKAQQEGNIRCNSRRRKETMMEEWVDSSIMDSCIQQRVVDEDKVCADDVQAFPSLTIRTFDRD